MKITSKHKRNSQLHSMPINDTIRHTNNLNCSCEPALSVVNGHIIVKHKCIGEYSKEWTVAFVNLGAKTLGGAL